VTTFTSTLSLTSASDLEKVDFVAMKAALATEQNWQDASVEVVVVVKVALQFTFSAVITETQCKAAVASVSGVSVSKVSCMSNASSASSASGATRRLQAVMDVEISYDDQSEAVDAVSTPQADMMAGLTTALAADSTVTTVITATGAADPVVTIELEFSVTADEAVAAPPKQSMETAVVSTATSVITVEATVSAAVVSYTRMPCSEGAGVCGSGFELLANSETLGCAAALCTTDDEDTCCTRMVVSDARSMKVLNSLLLLLLWNFL